jgi:hypothetical protein
MLERSWNWFPSARRHVIHISSRFYWLSGRTASDLQWLSYKIMLLQKYIVGRRWRKWLRHYAKSRKVASSIPDGVTENFHWHNSSGRTMALGSTQPLTEMSTKNTSWGGGGRWPVRRADNLTTFMYRMSWNVGASNSWNSQGLSRPVMGSVYLFYRNILDSATPEILTNSRLNFVKKNPQLLERLKLREIWVWPNCGSC